MTNNIKIFENPAFGQVRIVMNNSSEPLFCLADICKVLNLQNPTHTKNQITEEFGDDLHQMYPISDDLGRTQQTIFITEPQLYFVMNRSDKPQAKPFRMWVNSEVLPSIRKHGGYLTSQKIEEALLNPDTIITLATNLKQEREERLKLQKENARLLPKAQLMDKIMDADQKIDVGQTAKILGLPFGRNTLFKKLREKGIFFKNKNEPKQEYLDRGYFELKEKWIERTNHDGFVVLKILVTQKGLDFIAKKLNAIDKTA